MEFARALVGPAAGGKLFVSVLGPMRVAVDGIDVRIRSRKSRAVLAYLALSESRRETRERLVGLLWSESQEERARASLRQVVHELRERLGSTGYDGLLLERLELELARDGLDVDYWDVLRRAEAGQVHPRLLETPRLAETLLEGLDDLDPEFRVWLLARRQSFHDRLLRLLEAGLRDQRVASAQRRRMAEAVLQLDPTHEEACRALMRSCAEDGDTASALRHYGALWELLGDVYDMEPSQPTQTLVAEIKQGLFEKPAGGPAPARPPPQPAPSKTASYPPELAQFVPPAPIPFPGASDAVARAPAARLALLIEPFGMNGVGSDSAHLVAGFRHDLISRLVRFREWFVVAGTAMPDIAHTGSRVSAACCIDATAYQAGSEVNLVLTLRERDSGVYIWGDSFVLAMENWFQAQQRIVRHIAMSLNVQLSMQRLTQLASQPDVSLEVYDQWLRCQAMILGFKPDQWARAEQLLTETIAQAPRFSSAYSSLAQLDNTIHIVHPGVMRQRQREVRALELAHQAVRLDPADSRAQLCMGWSYAMSKQYGQAEIHMDLACELNPNDSWTLIAAALFHAFCGHTDKATDLARQSLGLTLLPTVTHWGYQVSIAYLCGDWEGTLRAADLAQDVICTLPAWRAAALWRLGRAEECAQHVHRFYNGVRSAWTGGEPPTEQACARWLLHLYPISRADIWESLREGIAGAGIPVEGIAHHQW